MPAGVAPARELGKQDCVEGEVELQGVVTEASVAPQGSPEKGWPIRDVLN